MVHLSLQSQELARVTTSSTTFYEWLKASPSRIWTKGEFFYPIEEINDILDFCNIVQIPVQMDAAVTEAYNDFCRKLQLLNFYKLRETLTDEEFKKFSVAPLFKGELFPGQRPIIPQMLLMKKYLLSLQVGMGKTVVSLYGLCLLKQLKPNLRALIICEANQLHKPWLETVYKLSNIKEITVLQGDMDSRKSTIYDPEAKRNWLWITTYDTIRIEKDCMETNWDVIIMDEITKVKNISSMVSKALKTFKATYFWGLSATPVMNTFFDLYGIMKIINPSLFTNKANFSNRYLILDIFNRPKKLNKLTVDELKRKIEPWYVQKVKEVQRPFHIRTIAVDLTPEQKLLLKDIVDDLESGKKTKFEVSTRLRMLCNTSKLFEQYKDMPLAASTNKLAELEKIVEEVVDAKSKKLVVFSYFVDVVNWLAEHLGKDYRTRVVMGNTKTTCKNSKEPDCFKCKHFKRCSSVKKYVHEFKFGDVEILLGTDSLSKSHDLYTCDSLVNFDLPWGSKDLEQRMGRVDRAVNTATEFFMWNLITKKTTEESIVKLIETKEKESGKVFPSYSVPISRLSKTIEVVE